MVCRISVARDGRGYLDLRMRSQVGTSSSNWRGDESFVVVGLAAICGPSRRIAWICGSRDLGVRWTV